MPMRLVWIDYGLPMKNVHAIISLPSFLPIFPPQLQVFPLLTYPALPPPPQPHWLETRDSCCQLLPLALHSLPLRHTPFLPPLPLSPPCRSPMFVLPVARDKGFVTMLAQAQMPHLLFTGLEDFKVRGPSAAPFFTVTHYPDLAAEKGVVLVRGDVVLPNKLSDDEARVLLKDLHSFYADDSRYRHVEAFNKRPEEFDYRAVVRALGIVAAGW
ncbi:unnamed protein product [Closterium sp. Naga37s-1]|nr:unnamed protein product [Closterium sp. Naga37s-1]